MKIAKVLIHRAVNSLYDYQIPDDLDVHIGTSVDVPLGKSTVTGLVCGITHYEHTTLTLKPISKIVTSPPQISTKMVALITWFSDYFIVTPYTAYNTIIGHPTLPKKSLPASTDLIITKSPLTTTTEQQIAIDTINSHTGANETLLHGVTASGKTEVYLQLAEHALRAGKDVLILIPEIALTPQFTQRFDTRFPNQVKLIHSGITPTRRNITWHQLLTQGPHIVIGARSAIFAPLENIGLIIIDEEHDHAYKQDQQPRYHTHEIAKFRAQQHNAKLVYGSATPSTELLYHAKHHHIHLIELKRRINQQPPPPVTIIPTSEIGTDILSPQLIAHIQTAKAQNEQAMILLNRRGYAPYVACQNCKKIHTCPHCKLSLTFHQNRTYHCHRCGLKFPFTTQCHFCKKHTLNLSGLGIQKVEMELKRHLPGIRINRLDRDSAKTPKQLEQTLNDFKENGDILLGTQMIAKGHDIPNVTVVGILGIDNTLHMPDFAATEKTFQLITQVAGRAGRANKPGLVILQSANEDHYAIQAASQHNTTLFYQHEIAYREKLGYPPFKALTHIIFSGLELREVQKTAQQVASILTQLLPETSELLGPSPAPIELIKNRYRWHILIKSPPVEQPHIKAILSTLPKPPNGIRQLFDFSPKSIL